MPSCILLHGSGASTSHPFLQTTATCLRAAGLSVQPRDFAYMHNRTGKAGFPSRMPVLQAELDGWMDDLAPDLLVGKSLGARVALSRAQRVGGLVLLGYPFHPPGKLEKTRLDGFQELTTPTLIFQGTRDPFGRPSEVAGYNLPACVRLVWLERADHDFAGCPQAFERVENELRNWLPSV